MPGELELRPDVPGTSPPGVSGAQEKLYFNSAKGEHDHRMRSLELGKLGGFLGGENNAPISIAYICIISGIILAIGCLVVAGFSAKPEAWEQLFEKVLAFIGMTVAYVFGRGARSKD